MPKFLAIRLTKPESDALTRVRAARELKYNARFSIKTLLSDLLSDAYVAVLEKRLDLPIDKTLPEIQTGTENERISFAVIDEHRVAFKALKVSSEGNYLNYGEADIIRQLILQADAKKL